MKDLSVFIKDEFIKNTLFKESVFVDSEEKINQVFESIANGNNTNIIFKNTGLKDYFINNLSIYRPDSVIINCNCTVDCFESLNLDNISGLIVFNNVKKCKYPEIIESIKQYKGILIC